MPGICNWGLIITVTASASVSSIENMIYNSILHVCLLKKSLYLYCIFRFCFHFLLSFLSPLSAHFCLLFFFLSFFQQTLAFTASFCDSFNNQITQTHSWPLHLFFPVLGPLSLLLTAWIILSQHLPKSSFS